VSEKNGLGGFIDNVVILSILTLLSLSADYAVCVFLSMFAFRVINPLTAFYTVLNIHCIYRKATTVVFD